jgi:hypothetical protein
MTLAVILFASIFCTAPARPAAGATPRQSAQPAPASQPAPAAQTAGEKKDQGTGSTAQSSSPTQPPSSAAAPTQTPSVQKPTIAKHRRKRRVIAANCVAPAAGAGSATAGSTPPGTSSNPTSQDPPAAAVTPNPAPTSAPTNCPPSKVIVRQGGTSEPTIRLAGGAVGDQAAQQRHTANQYLGATELNLKKIVGRQLTANQQDVVNQIHQFMAQSRSAVTAGDLELARTLAWKAQLLSEELVNPQK